MAKPNDPEGVGGWLLFLILALGVIGPSYGVYDGLANFREAELQAPELLALANWQHYKLVTWLVFALICVLRITAAARLLLTRSWTSVRFAILVMLLCPALLAASDLLLLWLLFGSGASTTATADILSGLCRQSLYAALWSWYLVRSVRVRNTYKPGRDSSLVPKPLGAT